MYRSTQLTQPVEGVAPTSTIKQITPTPSTPSISSTPTAATLLTNEDQENYEEATNCYLCGSNLNQYNGKNDC